MIATGSDNREWASCDGNQFLFAVKLRIVGLHVMGINSCDEIQWARFDLNVFVRLA